MKRIIFFLIFFFNILPFWKEGSFTIIHNSSAVAQTGQAQLNSWLQVRYPNYTVLNNTNSTSQVTVYMPNGPVVFNVNYMVVNSATNNVTGYIQPNFQYNSTPPPPPASSNHTNAGTQGSQQNYEQEWAEIDAWMDQVRQQNLEMDQAMAESWYQENYGGYEAPSGGPTCEETMGYGSSSDFEYSQALVYSSSNLSNFNSPGNGLPCTNRFLIGNKIISFTSSQSTGIQNYNFTGAELNGIVKDGKTYSIPSEYTVINERIFYQAWSSCTGGTSEWEDHNISFVNPQPVVTFVNFAQLNATSIANLPAGITKISGTIAGTNQSIFGYKSVPPDLQDISFSINSSNITDAVIGDQVLAVKKSGNTTSLYCHTLQLEDINRGLSDGRDKKYITDEIALKLEHPVNVPEWVREFLEFFHIPLSECTINKINDGLDALHAKPEYVNEPFEANKAIMEYKSIAYDMLFGALYCTFDENAAIGKSCAEQYAMGLMHEAIGSIDIAQMRDGIVNLVKGLGSYVQQNVKDMIDGVKVVIEDTRNTGVLDLESITKKIVKKNVSDLESAYNKAAQFAEHFKQMYFTNCGNLCCYRKGEITMMIVPIILTLGDYAVVKLTGLAAKYGTRAIDAIKMFKDAERLGAKVVNDVDKILIKESDDIDALVISTQEKVGNDITITGEEHLDNIMDVDDLKDVDVNNPIVNNEIVADPGNKTNGWNKKLNKQLEPNTTYKVGNKKYETDASGRVKKVTCDNLTLTTNDANRYQQSFKCKKIKDGIAGDDGGHLIGKQFNGAGEQINYVPMKSTINQSPGTWYNMEQEWRNALLQPNGTVTNVEIFITYGTNNRPTVFVVRADINGVPKQWSHAN